MGSVQHIRGQPGFDAVLKSAGKKLVVIDYSATWCGPCKRVAPVFEKLAAEHRRVVFAKIDVDESKDVAQKQGVKAMPTFMFYHEGKKLESETIQGAEIPKIEEAIKRLDKKVSPFSGGGHSLSGPSSSSSSSSNSSSSQAPKRRNPWASKTFVPPGMRKVDQTVGADELEKFQKERQQEIDAKVAIHRANPWAKDDFAPQSEVPKIDTPKPAPQQQQQPDAELQAAIAMSMQQDDNQKPADKMDVDQQGASSSSSSSDEPKVKATANPPELVAAIDKSILTQLTSMGFGQIRSEKAIILSKASTAEAAMNWLLAHEQDADIDEPLQIIGKQEKPKNKPKFNPSARGAPLGWKEGDDFSDEDDDPTMKAFKDKAKLKKARSKAAMPVGKQSTSEMTYEEKMEWLKKQKESRKQDIQKTKTTGKKVDELKRREQTKLAAETKRLREEQKMKDMAAKVKREKEREKAKKKAIKEKLRMAKQERQREFDEAQARLKARKAT